MSLPRNWTRLPSGDKNEKALLDKQRALKIDRAIGDTWPITEGLNPGDRLIVEEMQKVRPGAATKVVPFQEGETSGAAFKETAHAAPKSS